MGKLLNGVVCVVVALFAYLYVNPPALLTPTTIYPPINKASVSAPNDVGVVVVGASFAGMAVASELSLHGYKVVVISPVKVSHDAKKLTGGCTLRGSTVEQLANAFNISHDNMVNVLTNNNPRARFKDFVYGTGIGYIANHSVYNDETTMRVTAPQTGGVNVRHDDLLRRLRSHLEKNSAIEFVDKLISDISDAEAMIKHYKRKIVINATPNYSLLTHPTPPPPPITRFMVTQAPVKVTNTKSAIITPPAGVAWYQFFQEQALKKVSGVLVAHFTDDTYPESNTYIFVGSIYEKDVPEETQRKNIVEVLYSFVNATGGELIDEANSLFVGSVPVLREAPLSSYYHQSKDGSTAYITTALASAYGTPAIAADALLSHSTVARIINQQIFSGQLLKPDGGDILHERIQQELAGLRVRNEVIVGVLNTPLAVTQFTLAYGSGIFRKVLLDP